MCLEDFLLGRSMRYQKTVFTAAAAPDSRNFPPDKSRVGFAVSNPSAGTAAVYWLGSAAANPQTVLATTSTYEAKFDIRDYGQLVTDGFSIQLSTLAATVEVVELFLPTSASDVVEIVKDYKR